VLIITFFGSQLVQLWLQSFLHVLELPFSLAGPIAATCVLLAFLLTAWALRCSRQAYRSRANALADFPLAVGG
jgi:hypothetical protein